ncbi:spheroidene monooxygenase [Sulfitobacter sp. S190]|uniref:spheroidene monooxygenase n=1 Tax=Sulfitobacter sp. S190 TaxID=2867022 RepID=UPI0021A7C9FC|nr:spheroidene monooxygenase [Sulfitobacter sp. S190]UWR24370.1 spheroidene monooxygenase [Sulfitobacter sp. S190]
MSQVVSLSFFRFGTSRARLWAFAMMGLARPAMKRTPGIGFWKLCGSGTGEGFTPRPDLSVYAILATWPDEATARHQMARGIFARYRNKSIEDWTVYLSTTSVRGAWAGDTPFVAQPAAPDADGPIAALTRASVRLGVLGRFWRRVPNISDKIGRDPSVLFKQGIGERPWVHQVTFSIWPDQAAMNAFARTGPHAEAIRAVRDHGWFAEELYARFSLVAEEGSWDGRAPLLTKDTA